MTVALRNNMKFEMPTTAEMSNLVGFCRVMAEAPFYQKLGAGGVLAIYLTAKERNLPFMSCLNGGLHVIEGKITYSGGMVAALILNSGHDYKIIKSDENECEILFIRGDRAHDPEYKPQSFKYSMQDAKIAGYLGIWDKEGRQIKNGKDNWIKNPKPMLFNRCVMGGMRLYMPEIALGVLVAGELVGTDADGHIEPTVIQPVVTESLQKEECQSVTEPLQIDSQIVEDFKQKYNIGTDCDHDKYLATISKHCKKTIDEVLVLAASNQTGFDQSFEKWKSKNS